jgi:N12 class adenine-specific DNA methylase
MSTPTTNNDTATATSKSRRGISRGTKLGIYAADAPIPEVAPHLFLSEAEEAVLSRKMEYSRKGALKNKVFITRQQWIEDFLTRGFSSLEKIASRLRVRNDDTGAFYDLFSAVEKGYLMRRHAEIHGSPRVVEAAPAEVPKDTGGGIAEAARQRKFLDTMRRTGVADYRGVTYKVVPVGDATPAAEFQLERIFKGQHEACGSVVGSIEAVVDGAVAEALRFFSHLKAEARARRRQAESAAPAEGQVVVPVADPVLSQAEADAADEEATEAKDGPVTPQEAAVPSDPVVLPTPDDSFAPATEARDADPKGEADRLAELALGDLDARAVGRLYAGLRDPAVRERLWPALFGQGRPVADAEAEIVAALRSLAGEQAWAAYLDLRREQNAVKKERAERVELPRFSFARGEGEKVSPRTRSQRIAANLAAIKLLKQIEAENRPATEAEVQMLSLYSGWGGDKEVLNSQMLQELERRREVHGDKWREETRKEASSGSYRADREYLESFLNWHKTYGETAEELKALLTTEEWNAALQSVLNAHYTDGEVCHALWDIAVRAGFKGGRVLEPAVGSGRILAAMPLELRSASRIDAVELDSLSARLAAKLHPDVQVQQAAFEESSVPDGAYDLVISNVPFGKVGPGVQEGLGDTPFNLHNYCIAESMRKLKQGGLAVIITSASTLDNNPDQKLALSKLSELRGAIRLPGDAFADNAGTEVVTDILLLRKPSEQIVPGGYIWTSAADVPLAEPFKPKNQWGNSVMVPLLDAEGKKVKKENAWGGKEDVMVEKTITTTRVHGIFADQPGFALGEHSLAGKMYGRDSENGQYTLKSPKGAPPIAERITAVLPLLPENLPNPSLERWSKLQNRALAEVNEDEDEAIDIVMPARPEPGLLFRSGGKYYECEFPPNRGARAVEFSANEAKSLDLYIELRERLRELLVIDRMEPDPSERSAEARKRLNDAYEACVLSAGSVSQVIARLQTVAAQEPWMQSVVALEQVREQPAVKGRRPVREYFPAPILTRRTVFATICPARAETLAEAVTQSRAVLGRIEAGYVAGQLGKDASDPATCEAVASAITDAGLGYRMPADSGRLVAADDYLSGNLFKKLADAKRAAQTDARFLSNVKALEEYLPPPATWDDVRAPIGAQFVPAYIYGRFLNDTLKLRLSEEQCAELVRLHEPSGRFMVKADELVSSAASRFANEDLSLKEAISHAFLQTEPTIKTKKGGATILDVTATDVARGLVKNFGEAWKLWVESHADAKQEVLEAYNRTFGAYVTTKKTNTEHLVFPGLSPDFKPRPHQLSALADLLPNPQGVVAYNVGFGKTAIGIILAAESRRIGTAKKPMIVCDTANYLQFVQAMRDLYPSAKLLVADDANFSPAERERFKAQIAYGDHDCVLVSRTQFEKIPISAETEREWIERELAEMRAVQSAMGYDKEAAAAEEAPRRRRGGGDKASKRLAREMANAIESNEQELKAILHARAEDRGLTWDQLGIDLLIVDEAHRHKKIGINTVHSEIKGIDTGRSKRGFDLLIKGRYIQERRGGKGVVGLTGTPCTNTMAEFHTMQKIFAPKVCEDLGVVHFDAFKSAFCEVGEELAMHEATGKWRMEQRLRKFINGRAFVSFIRAGMLVEMDSSKLKLNVPKHEKGDIEFEIVPLNQQTLSAMEDIGDIYAQFEELEKEEREEFCFVPLMLMQAGMVASIDPRLLHPDEPMAPDGVIVRVASNAAEIYHDPAHVGAAQVVFLDRYGEMNTSKLDDLRAGGVKKAAGMLVLDDDDDDPRPRKKGDDEDEAAPESPEPSGRKINLYRDLKAMLVERGVPADKIVLISDVAKKDRASIFDKVNRGEVQIVIGSSDKLGIGANFQKKLYAAHHVDPPRFMTPDQMEQRNGRILRDGNGHSAVRVIYYGMEDTCCPAIYGRIQRKAQFIKQGYADKGVGAEFEDVSEVRLEELKAALVPDKRAMQLAELKAELAAEVRTVDSAERRRYQIKGDLSTASGAVDFLSGPGLQRAKARVEWFVTHVQPVPDPGLSGDADKEVVVTLSDLHGAFFPERMRDWLKENGAEVRGPCRAVVAKLDELIALCDEVELNRSDLRRALGKIRVNGVPIDLFREQVMFASSGRQSIENMAVIYDPANPASDLVRPLRIRSGNAILKQARLAIFESEHDLKSIESRLADAQARLKNLRDDIANLPEPSRARVDELKTAVKALEADMAANPYVRGSRLKAKQTAAVAAAVPAAPSIPDQVAGRRSVRA